MSQLDLLNEKMFKGGVMSNKDLMNTAPSIFTKTSSDNTSDKYVHIPTNVVIEDMRKLGWNPVFAKQVNARKNIGFQKHMVIFRNENFKIEGKDGDDVFPQVILTNSHDGKNAFNFKAGLFRLVCSNGLIATDKELEKVSIRHMGYTFEDLKTKVNTMIDALPTTVELMNKMKNVTLKPQQANLLANAILKARFADVKKKFNKVAVEQVLEVKRKQDEGFGLWEVFNRIQENVMSGDFSTLSPKGTLRKARPIKNFNQDLELNSKMWELASEYVA